MMHSVYIFTQFFRRDVYVHAQQWQKYLINYTLIYPVIFTFLTSYLQANTYFGEGNARMGTILATGNIVVMVMVFTFVQNIDLLFDLETTKYIDYQIIILNPLLVLIERAFFISVLCFVLVAPYYPIAKLFLPSYLDTSSTNWLNVMLIIYFGSLACSAYHLMATCILKSSNNITSLWKRFNSPMIDFGGMWIPWFILHKFSPLLGALAYLNPLMYFSDGMKQALVGGPEFFSIAVCVPMLFLFSVVFLTVAFFVFKKRVDCL